MGIAGDPMLRHHACEEAAGRPVFLIPGDVYVAKKMIDSVQLIYPTSRSVVICQFTPITTM
jgi:hypothetical protein